MKAVVVDRYGPPEVLRVADLAKPHPAANQVLVRVHAAMVSAGDVRLRQANPAFVRLVFGLSRPRFRVLGFAFAGTVEDVGKDITLYRKGDEVFGSPGMSFGANAEYVCVAETSLARKPGNASFAEAAAIVFGGMSAVHFLRQANVQPGQRVLIHGASGSVGTAMVQLAKHFGAQVTGVCSTGNLALVRSLGADQVVDYTKNDFSTADQVYDVVVDGVGKAPFEWMMRSLKHGGAYVFVSSGLGSYLGAVLRSFTGRVKVVGGVARGKPGDLDFLKGLVEAGAFKPVVDRTYPLDQIVEAHRYAQTGHVKGNVVISIG